MILYFSGTGNSAYAAEKIAKVTGDKVIDLFDRIRSHNYSEINSGRPWVVVTPTYAWRIPRIVQEWLENTDLVGNKDIYFVMTCGGSIGNAGKYLKELCTAKKLNYLGCAPVLMPENYIAMFSTPTQEKALEIIRQSDPVIDKIALEIKSGKAFPQPAVSFQDKRNSGIINTAFYPIFVHAKKFYATDACVSCGKCVNVCPLENVRLKDGKPVWGKNCTHCMACICRCPSEAIEYGRHSRGLPRYVFPKNIPESK